MSHYDNCRDGYCGCGQSLSVEHTCRVTELKQFRKTWTDAEWAKIEQRRKEMRERLLEL
jgi:hypothetical protein